MNRKDIRSAVFNRADSDPEPTQSAVDDLNELINQALPQVCLEAPFMFYNSFVRFATQPDVEPAGDTDLVMLAPDTSVSAVLSPWVFCTTLAAGAAGAAVWKNDRSWDGRHIYIYDEDGEAHENQIRTIWQQSATLTVDGVTTTATRVFFTVMKPWPAAYGSGPFTWKVFTKEYFLYDDVVNIHSARIVGDVHPIDVISQDDAERSGIVDHTTTEGAVGGIPSSMYRRSHVQLPTPNTAPTVALGDVAVAAERWKGPEPPGTFEYCFTLTWGKRDVDYQNPGISHFDTGGDVWTQTPAAPGTSGDIQFAVNRMREPMWESAPSPISAEVTVGPPTLVQATWTAPAAVKLTLPNIEYMLGMFLILQYSATLGITSMYRRLVSSESGWHIRIYRRRSTENFTDYSRLGGALLVGSSVPTLHKLDIRDDFFLLSEVRIEELNEGYWIDNGTIIPDFLRPLRDIHGYQGVRLHPNPDDRYEIELRYTRRPPPLTNDQDVPQIHAEAMMLVVEYTLALYMDKLHEPAKAAAAWAKYRDALKTLRKRYGDLRPQEQPTARRPARIPRYSPYATRWWRRSN